MKLNVFFSDKLAGNLESTPDRGVVFRYDTNFIKGGIPLSQSLPLQTAEFSQQDSLPFFSGILPEGDVKHRISDFLHISETSTFKLLQELGGDCAGMISILPESEQNFSAASYPLNENFYEKISNETLLEFIQNENNRPLLKAREELRLSLAGAQEKLPLAYFDGCFYLPKNGAPSTHILKPTGNGELVSLAANEYICMQLARNVGLSVPESALCRIGSQTFFLIERYDRWREANRISRLHQEDMCQALGILSDHKYQNDGGPGIFDIYNLLKQKATIPLLDTRRYLQYVLFNLIIGNCDAHGKNYSLLYEGSVLKLSPIYDVVCTVVYPSLTKKMSMKIGKHYEIERITKDDLRFMADEIGLRQTVLVDMYSNLLERVIKSFEKLTDDISLVNFEKAISSR